MTAGLVVAWLAAAWQVAAGLIAQECAVAARAAIGHMAMQMEDRRHPRPRNMPAHVQVDVAFAVLIKGGRHPHPAQVQVGVAVVPPQRRGWVD